MSLRNDLRTFCLADATIAALIGTRLHPSVLPQNPVLPAVTYQWVSAPRDYTMAGPTGYVVARVQFDVYSKTADEAEAVFEAFRLRLSGYRGPVGGSPPTPVQGAFLEAEQDMHEPQADTGTGSGAGLHRRSADYLIHHEEALT